MILKSGFVFTFELRRILTPRYPPIFHYCYTSKSEKSPPITIKIKKKLGKSPTITKFNLNLTNKVLFGPLLKKSSASKKNQKELTKEAPVTPKKNYSSLTFTNTKENFTNDTAQLQVFYKNENFIETISSEQLSNKDVKLDPLILSPLINPIKKNKFPSNNDDFIYNISIFEGGYKKLPSVSNILQATMPPERQLILQRWEQNMILKLGEEGFKAYKQALFDRGNIFHKCIEMKLRKEEVTEEQLVGIDQFWNSVKDVLNKIINVKVLESRVIHSQLEYQGCVDCVGFYRDIPVVIEFKTSTKPKLNLISTYDNPLQLAAYLGALNYDATYNSFPNVSEALLVIGYDTGLPAHVHFISKEKCQKYWSIWCQRLRKFKVMNSSSNEK